MAEELTIQVENNHWVLSEAAGLEATITFESINCTIALADVYAQIDWNEEGMMS